MNMEKRFVEILSQQNAKGAEQAKSKQIQGGGTKADVEKLDREEKVEVKKSILNQYSQIEVELDGDDTDALEIAPPGPNDLKPAVAKDKKKGPPKVDDPLMMKNTNADAVADAEKARREKSRQEAEAKKVSDKVNREKQKQKDVERKEKEKQRTQKGERRR